MITFFLNECLPLLPLEEIKKIEENEVYHELSAELSSELSKDFSLILKNKINERTEPDDQNVNRDVNIALTSPIATFIPSAFARGTEDSLVRGDKTPQSENERVTVTLKQPPIEKELFSISVADPIVKALEHEKKTVQLERDLRDVENIQLVQVELDKEGASLSNSLMMESPFPLILEQGGQGRILYYEPQRISIKKVIEEKLFNEVRFLIGKEEKCATIDMDPPELGKIKVEVIQVKEKTHILFRVPIENNETRTLIEHSLSKLIHQFELNGMPLGEISVTQEDFCDTPRKPPDPNFLTIYSKEESNEEKEIVKTPSSLHLLDLYI